MELYDRILKSDNPSILASTYKKTLKKEHSVLNKTMIGMFMTLAYGDTVYNKEIQDIEEKLSKIDACLALAQNKFTKK